LGGEEKKKKKKKKVESVGQPTGGLERGGKRRGMPAKNRISLPCPPEKKRGRESPSLRIHTSRGERGKKRGSVEATNT